MSGISAGLAGIQDGMERLGAAAAQITGSAAPGYEAHRVEPVRKVEGYVQTQVREEPRDRVDISEQAVEMMEAEHQVAVNVHALQRLNEIQSALVEIGE